MSGEALQIALKRREVKSKGEKETQQGKMVEKSLQIAEKTEAKGKG